MSYGCFESVQSSLVGDRNSNKLKTLRNIFSGNRYVQGLHSLVSSRDSNSKKIKDVIKEMAQNLLLVVVQTEKELLGPMFPLVDSLKLKLILRRLLHYVELKT